MKFIFTIVLLFPALLVAQQPLQISDSRTIYIEKVIQAPQYSKHGLYEKALGWTSEVFTSPKDAIRFKDPELGKIKINLVLNYKVGLSSLPFVNSVTIYIKDHKLKIRIDNIFELETQKSLGKYILKRDNTFRKYSGMTENITRQLNDLINSLNDYIQSKQDSNW